MPLYRSVLNLFVAIQLCHNVEARDALQNLDTSVALWHGPGAKTQHITTNGEHMSAATCLAVMQDAHMELSIRHAFVQLWMGLHSQRIRFAPLRLNPMPEDADLFAYLRTEREGRGEGGDAAPDDGVDDANAFDDEDDMDDEPERAAVCYIVEAMLRPCWSTSPRASSAGAGAGATHGATTEAAAGVCAHGHMHCTLAFALIELAGVRPADAPVQSGSVLSNSVCCCVHMHTLLQAWTAGGYNTRNPSAAVTSPNGGADLDSDSDDTHSTDSLGAMAAAPSPLEEALAAAQPDEDFTAGSVYNPKLNDLFTGLRPDTRMGCEAAIQFQLSLWKLVAAFIGKREADLVPLAPVMLRVLRLHLRLWMGTCGTLYNQGRWWSCNAHHTLSPPAERRIREPFTWLFPSVRELSEAALAVDKDSSGGRSHVTGNSLAGADPAVQQLKAGWATGRWHPTVVKGADLRLELSSGAELCYLYVCVCV